MKGEGREGNRVRGDIEDERQREEMVRDRVKGERRDRRGREQNERKRE